MDRCGQAISCHRPVMPRSHPLVNFSRIVNSAGLPTSSLQKGLSPMQARSSLRLALAGGLLALLAACGDDSSSSSTPAPAPASTAPTAAQQTAFATDYTGGVNALGGFGGLTSTAFVDNFDDAFLDAGYTKAQVRDNLAQEAAAMAISPDLSSFPMGQLSDVTITACDASGVCTLTATLTNSDADATAVTFTTQVKVSNGKVRLYGDQKTA